MHQRQTNRENDRRNSDERYDERRSEPIEPEIRQRAKHANDIRERERDKQKLLI